MLGRGCDVLGRGAYLDVLYSCLFLTDSLIVFRGPADVIDLYIIDLTQERVTPLLQLLLELAGEL